jgi:nucleoside-diphosphate-sugar epimerase
VDGWLKAAGLPPVKKRISKKAAFAAASACEKLWGMLGLKSEPPVTKFLVIALTTAHWFDISAAKRELGWRPKVKIEDGMERVAHWIRAARPFD